MTAAPAALAPDPTLAPFLAPRGVAVVGASHDPEKLGFALARNLVASGYAGAVHFVNPKGGALLGRAVHRTLAEVPDPVDLAVLLVPAPAMPAAIQACGERGIRAAVLASGGFREVGPEGRALEARCLAVARTFDIRLVGPNGVGLLDTHLPLDTTFLPPPAPPRGDVAFLSHSGAICAAVVDWARGQGFGLSRLVSLGNGLDVTETDLLAPTAADPHTRVVALYLEGLRDGRRFVEQAAAVTRVTPVVALKVGRRAGGRRAAASHTGALAGSEAAFDAAFRRAGVLRAETTEDLFDQARALAWCPLPAGRRVAVLTNAGGPAVTAADAIEGHGLALAELAHETRERLRAFLPPAASVANPVDMLASASAEDYGRGLRLLLDDPGVDAVVVITPPPPASSAGAVARALVPAAQGAGKPVLAVLMGDRMVREGVEYVRAARLPDFRYPERAVAALAALGRHADYLREAPAAPRRFADVDAAAVRAFIADAEGFLPARAAARVLEAYGLAVAAPVPAASAEEAAAVAARVGFPVALKLDSPDVPHKRDVGGVRLGLDSEAEVRVAFEEVVAAARAARPEARVEGVTVQRMAPEGQEVVVGAVQDPTFGALAMFGSGGTEVEGLGDVAFGLAPLPEPEADAMMDATWAGRRLAGFRHLPPADRPAAREALLRLAQLAADVPEIAEVEVNPLRVLPDGQGVVAVDARVRVQRT